MKSILQNNFKLENLFSKKIFKIIAFIVITIISTLFCFFIIKIEKAEYFNLISKKRLVDVLTLFFCFALTISIELLIKFVALNKKMLMHKKFLIIAIVIGGFYLILTPFLNGADELPHFCRIYEITEGNFITPNDNSNMLPSSIKEYELLTHSNFKYKDIKNNLTYPLNKDIVEPYGTYYVSASLYSPFQYIPQAIGVGIGKLLNLSIGITGFLGRITGFIFWLLLSTYSIKIVPNKKMFFTLLFLSPICIGYAITLSGDMMLNSITLLLVCYVYKLWCEKKVINKKDYAILMIASVVLSLCKVVYVPIVLIIFFIPKECFKNRKRYFINLLIIFLISCLFALTWMKCSNNYITGYYDSSQAQQQFIFSNPIQYIIIMIRTLFEYFNVYLIYNSQFKLSSFISIMLWVLVICALWGENDNREVNLKSKLCFAAICILVIILIETALYIQFTATTVGIGNKLVDGIQSRYFLPLLIMSGLIVTKKRIIISKDKLLLIMLIINIPIILQMYMWYIS